MRDELVRAYLNLTLEEFFSSIGVDELLKLIAILQAHENSSPEDYGIAQLAELAKMSLSNLKLKRPDDGM